MSSKTPAADRSHGGPGSSNENADKPGNPDHYRRASGGHSNNPPRPGTPTNETRAEVSSGGGEQDAKHTHDPLTKR